MEARRCLRKNVPFAMVVEKREDLAVLLLAEYAGALGLQIFLRTMYNANFAMVADEKEDLAVLLLAVYAREQAMLNPQQLEGCKNGSTHCLSFYHYTNLASR